jgi:tagatose 1,6-diphosphate aldolase GatY/KbaY
MSYVSTAQIVGQAFRAGYAVPAFCAWNAEVMECILRAAERLRSPVILMQGPGEFPVLPPAPMAAVAHALKARHDVPAALHLDHGDSMEMVRDCVAARYTSVMLDFSARSFDENADALAAVVALARPRGISVEGEIGRIGKADEQTSEGSARSALTDPAEAVAYVTRTGVDSLAVSIGTKHGFYPGEPRLDFGLLSELHAALPVPLVLHGGTGIPEEHICRAIELGIAKVNVASELVHGLRASLSSQWEQGRNMWTPLALAEAEKGLAATVKRWMRITGAAGRA